MQELDDMALLCEYVERDSEEAFATLITRHVNKVYSVALRHTNNPQQAEEITQAVFVILARKSRHLSNRVILEGWLYETTRLTAVTFIRSEIRRARREQEAHMQTTLNKNESDVWPQIVPLLDTALAGLNKKDRHAVVLRFFYGRSMKEIGTALGSSEDTARMRINRAIEKLRKFFMKRGVSSTAATIAGAISSNSVQAAPVALAKSVTTVAVAKGATASTSTLNLIKGALKIMAWSKAKSVIVVSVAMILVALSVQHFRHSSGPDIRAMSGADIRGMSEADVRKTFTGNWVPQGSTWGGLVLHSRGGFSNRLRSDSTSDAKQWLYEGTWAVKDEFLTLTITNAIARNTADYEPVGSIDQFTIIKVDESHLVLEKDGVKTYFLR